MASPTAVPIPPTCWTQVKLPNLSSLTIKASRCTLAIQVVGLERGSELDLAAEVAGGEDVPEGVHGDPQAGGAAAPA